LFNYFKEYTFEDSDDWDKPRSFFGPNGIGRTIVQLLKQLDGIELHYKRNAKTRKTKEINVVSNPTFAQLKFLIPTFVSPFS
jgi:hypothetical protein